MMRSISSKYFLSRASKSLRVTRPSELILPIMVSATACGWSAISLAINDGQPPLEACDASQSISNSLLTTGVPSKLVTLTPVELRLTIWSCPTEIARLVCSTKAATSLPRKFSPSPRPITNGAFLLAAKIKSGNSSWMIKIVKAPWRRFTTLPKAKAKSPDLSNSLAIKCAATSESVSLAKLVPDSKSSCLSSAKFSMIPL